MLGVLFFLEPSAPFLVDPLDPRPLIHYPFLSPNDKNIPSFHTYQCCGTAALGSGFDLFFSNLRFFAGQRCGPGIFFA